MSEARGLRVAIVDYRLGNLFSVKQACLWAGLDAAITSSADDVRAADAVILPGVGAFGDAIGTLGALGLIDELVRAAGDGKPFIGICLGMQLLMDHSEEFGNHAGLGLIRGSVTKLPDRAVNGAILKIPHVGWNRVSPPRGGAATEGDRWRGTSLAGLAEGEYMYFVHSYKVEPAEPADVTGMSEYGGHQFCSAVERDNVVGWQFHPERSGPRGLLLYQNLAAIIRRKVEAKVDA